MRHFAMTGISTTAMISRITFGEAMRATPPSARICAGTRSSAITAAAPAVSAISACFAVVTSMITPPFSISGRPVFKRRLVVLFPLFCDMGLLSSWLHSILQRVDESRYPGELWLARSCCVRWQTAELSIPPSQHRACRGPRCARLGRARAPVPTRALAVHKSCEHFVRIDRYKQALTAGQHFPFFVQDLGHVDVLPALHLYLARFHAQRLFQRHRLQVVYGHLGSHRHHMTQFVHLAHGFVEDGRDNAAVAVSRRSGVAPAQVEAADETIAVFVVGEAQPHAIGVVLAAGEAAVLRQFYVTRVVSSLGASGFALLSSHRKILSRTGLGTVYHVERILERQGGPHVSRPNVFLAKTPRRQNTRRPLHRSSWRFHGAKVDRGTAGENRADARRMDRSHEEVWASDGERTARMAEERA